MVKKLLLVLLLSIFLFADVAQAQANDLPEPGLLPDGPFYFLKNWSETIGTFFTFGEVAKARRFLNLSEKRLAEAKALVAKGKPEVAEKTVGRYQEQLNRALAKAEEAKAKGLDVDEVLAKVSEATLKHQTVLVEVYEKVPVQARLAIQQAMQASMRRHEEALRAISERKREEVRERVEQKRQEVEQKLEKLKDKGIPIPTIPGRPETPGRPEAQKQEREAEVEKPEFPMVETEISGGAAKPERGRPETPRRP